MGVGPSAALPVQDLLPALLHASIRSGRWQTCISLSPRIGPGPGVNDSTWEQRLGWHRERGLSLAGEEGPGLAGREGLASLWGRAWPGWGGTLLY